jgi:hypothetical protein
MLSMLSFLRVRLLLVPFLANFLCMSGIVCLPVCLLLFALPLISRLTYPPGQTAL